MTNNAKKLPPIPAKRYFSLNELCELLQISTDQFAEWQYANGTVVGYGGNSYTRQDVVKMRQLKDTFEPFIDEFNQNALDAEGKLSMKADEVRAELEELLETVENTLVY